MAFSSVLRNAGGDKLRCAHVGPAGSVERVYIGEQLSATYYDDNGGVKYIGNDDEDDWLIGWLLIVRRAIW